MALNYVTLTLDLYDGSGRPLTKGTVSLAPSVQLTDATDHEIITLAPVTASLGTSGPPAVKLLATDNGNPLPAGWAWTVTFSGVPGNPASFSFFLPFSGGAAQNLSALSPVSNAVTQYPSWPGTALGDTVYGGASPAGTPTRLAGNTTGTKNFLTQTGTGSVSAAPAWGAIAAADLPAGTTGAKGALQLDGTASDIAMDGAQAAGSIGKAADAGHVHPSDTSRLPLTGGTLTAPLTITTTGAANLDLTAASSGNFIIQGSVSGDTNPRFVFDSNGKMQFGPGNAGTDTDLYRASAGVLETDGSMVAAVSVTAPLYKSGLSGGGTMSQGSGAPSKPGGVNPVAGDIWFRTDTPGTANQRIYICTTGGASPVWAGIA